MSALITFQQLLLSARKTVCLTDLYLLLLIINILNLILSVIMIIVPALIIRIISAIEALSDEDRVLDYGGLGNFSLSGFEMVSSIASIHLSWLTW